MATKLYSIRSKRNANTEGVYIKHCDDRWYESAPYPLCKFTIEEARQIAQQMKKHYCYVTEILNEKGEIVEVYGYKLNKASAIEKIVKDKKVCMGFNSELLKKTAKNFGKSK